jgi:aerobactin synthase
MYVKDLQGDLRLVQDDLPELASLSSVVKKRLTRLPPHYLIHDLQTGHLITVLRFVSATLQEAMEFPEEGFYQILSVCLQKYQESQPGLAERFRTRPLLEPTMVRVLINRVRFQIGYADSAERPLPTLGTDLRNPLYPQPSGVQDVSPIL